MYAWISKYIWGHIILFCHVVFGPRNNISWKLFYMRIYCAFSLSSGWLHSISLYRQTLYCLPIHPLISLIFIKSLLQHEMSGTV